MKTLIVVVSVVFLFAGALPAGEHPTNATGKELDKKIEKAIETGTPGEHHKALEPFVGKFETTSRMWVGPDAEPQECTGTSENTLVFGGRFLKMVVRGDVGGRPFEAVGYVGYDNIRGEYVSVWLDNLNTGITQASGKFDSRTKTYTETGTFSCALTGQKDVHYRAECKVVDDDTLSYTQYNIGPGGKEVKAVETTFKRME